MSVYTSEQSASKYNVGQPELYLVRNEFLND